MQSAVLCGTFQSSVDSALLVLRGANYAMRSLRDERAGSALRNFNLVLFSKAARCPQVQVPLSAQPGSATCLHVGTDIDINCSSTT